jgi:hypothetical protein
MKAIINYRRQTVRSQGEREVERVLCDPEAETVISRYSGDEGTIQTWFNDGWRIESTGGYAIHNQGPQVAHALTLVLVREDATFRNSGR